MRDFFAAALCYVLPKERVHPRVRSGWDNIWWDAHRRMCLESKAPCRIACVYEKKKAPATDDSRPWKEKSERISTGEQASAGV